MKEGEKKRNRYRRKITHAYLSVPQDSSSQTKELLLSNRQVTPARRNLVLESPEPLYTVGQVDPSQSRPNFHVPVLLQRIQVLPNRPGEQERILRDAGQTQPQSLNTDVRYVHRVYGYFTGIQLH